MFSSNNTTVSSRSSFRDSSRNFLREKKDSHKVNTADLLFALPKEAINSRGTFNIDDEVLVMSPFTPKTPVVKMKIWSFQQNNRATLIDEQGFLHLAEQTSVFSSASPACFRLYLPVKSRLPQGFSLTSSNIALP